MKKKEIIYLLIAIVILAIAYHYTKQYGEKTEERVKELVEEKEGKKE